MSEADVQITFNGAKAAVEKMLRYGTEFENLMNFFRLRLLEQHHVALFIVDDLAGRYLVTVNGEDYYTNSITDAFQHALDYIDGLTNGNAESSN